MGNDVRLGAFRRIGFTCFFPASSLITPHLLHLCFCLYILLSDRQPVPDYRKPCPLPRILLPDPVLPALTLFLSPDHCIPHIHWVCKPDNRCDANLLSPGDYTEELKLSFLSLPRILKRWTKW
ncbi:hypothetical protein ATANTOWER_006008 [Ataeniobius toweri]|uniref:Uncharacterized protein n=1 Tax=Ataeniobius toweri TaxID=208326 RepID=A0ABU7BE17_9TELE|nr:hypothetical protein [Ataeniobius toweri]